MKAEQAKQLVAGVLDQLASALEQGHSATMQAYLAAMGRFHRYSLNNAMLIAMQRPDATKVAGFHTWRQLGRQVRRGEKGIAILAPIVWRRRQHGRAAGASVSRMDEPDTADEGETAIGEHHPELVRGFRGAYVFDISQTDGDPLPGFACVRGKPGEYLQRLIDFVVKRGVKLRYTPDVMPAYGATRGGVILLLPSLSPAEEFSTLAHELAHVMLHADAAGTPEDQAVRETEAEAVAYAVCTAVGLDTNTACSDYIQLYDGNRDTLLASLERIHATATEIIRGVTNPLEVGPRSARLTTERPRAFASDGLKDNAAARQAA